MNILLISQCKKNALKTTRRIIDQFAERCGDRCWHTQITMEGLNTLQKLLKQSARKNSAIACFRFQGRIQCELLWVVGDKSRFNEEGSIPTNTTHKNVLKQESENNWNTLEDIFLMVGIAALFHDFGKANNLFQNKLKKAQKTKEPYRHEWISLSLFQSFLGDAKNDREWLEKLAYIDKQEEKNFFKLFKPPEKKNCSSPFSNTMPPFAQAVAWLILSHHRLPHSHKKPGEPDAPRLGRIKYWLNDALKAHWNSPQILEEEKWKNGKLQNVWKFKTGLPFRSSIWIKKAQKLGRRALKRDLPTNKDWFEDSFSLHLARLILMLSDHIYSAKEPDESIQDKNYQAYANTGYQEDKQKLKQKLDEHNVGVCNEALAFTKKLPSLLQDLPAITRHSILKKRTTNEYFKWQNKAYDAAKGLQQRSQTQGFFGVNMASTGRGKTFANARIMYGLSNEKQGCRFSVAIGLRSLTLQTGDAFREKLRLKNEDLAVLIGSSAISRLHKLNRGQKNNRDSNEKQSSTIGSESSEDLLGEIYVRYDSPVDTSGLSEWLSKKRIKKHSISKLAKLIHAPVVVSTIDHLMPATESQRGGKQIAPMLRLLSSDLVLDEPDDFNLEDLPALTRLVHWAGMLGSKVLISSATLPPSIVQALFEAYSSGRKQFRQARQRSDTTPDICCAWFDENQSVTQQIINEEEFRQQHAGFVSKRCKNIMHLAPLRKGIIHTIDEEAPSSSAIECLSNTIHNGIIQLHDEHFIRAPSSKKTLSIGLVRMANINPLVAVAETLIRKDSPSHYRIHYCIYHSQFPLAVRSEIEKQLDSLLTRHNPSTIWDWNHSSIPKALQSYPEEHHIFVVLATPVAEVGRDHDYDWIIAEPSSMRSIIQLAGRLLRHRLSAPLPKSPNFYVLNKNYRALKKEKSKIAFHKPGFESEQFALDTHDLRDLLDPKILSPITSLSRIQIPGQFEKTFIGIEHSHTEAQLFGNDIGFKTHAKYWWNEPYSHWSYEMQRRLPFRASEPQNTYCFLPREGDFSFHLIDDDKTSIPKESELIREQLDMSPTVSLWPDINYKQIIEKLSLSLNLELEETCRQFGTISLREVNSDLQWRYAESFGFYTKNEEF